MIILIDNYDSFTYNLYQALIKYVDDVRVIRNDTLSIEAIEQLKPSGLVISPGPGRPEKSGICVELVKTMSRKTPILGVCLGHQIISIAFGGKVCLAYKAVHGKQAKIQHYRQGIYAHMPMPFRAARYHSLIVDRVNMPADFIVESETDEGEVMGMRHKDLPVFGVQFHPESILTPEGDRLISQFMKVCGENYVSAYA